MTSGNQTASTHTSHRRSLLHSQLVAGFPLAAELSTSQLASEATEVPKAKELPNVSTINKVALHVESIGVHFHRGFGLGKTAPYDPFLLLDDKNNDDPRKYSKGFPRHPHRGIETTIRPCR